MKRSRSKIIFLANVRKLQDQQAAIDCALGREPRKQSKTYMLAYGHWYEYNQKLDHQEAF